MFKKTLALMTAAIMMFALAACGQTPAENTETSASSGSGTSAPADSEKTEPSDGKTLVVYFSWSGNTENVAKSIQSQTDSDIFEIVPVTPYSDDYDTVVDLAQEEQRNNARPAISGDIENLEQYDVIYIGFPKL